MRLGGHFYRTLPGDTLVSISQKFYKTDDRAILIFKHNTEYIENPNNVQPGLRIWIPSVHHLSVVVDGR